LNPTPPRRFFRPRAELVGSVEFSFVFPDYRDRPTLATTKRLPTGRATIFFAQEVVSASLGGGAHTGLFFEGPQSEGFTTSSEYGEVVGVKLRFGAARAVMGLPAKQLRDLRVPLEVLWGGAGRALSDRMANAGSALEKLRLLEAELVRRLGGANPNESAAIRAVELIEQTEGQLLISELCDRFGCSKRGLLYRFDEYAGLSPKQYARIVRIRTCVARLRNPPAGWAELAAECGFYDQAHLVREFRALLGQPPAVFARERGAYNPIEALASGSESLPSSDRDLYHSLGFVSEWATP
jgi:AraC-like DNA-binding protein